MTDSLRYFGIFDGYFRQAVERIGGAERCVAVLTRLQTLLYPPPPTPTDVSAAEQQVRARHSNADSDADSDGCDHDDNL